MIDDVVFLINGMELQLHILVAIIALLVIGIIFEFIENKSLIKQLEKYEGYKNTEHQKNLDYSAALLESERRFVTEWTVYEYDIWLSQHDLAKTNLTQVKNLMKDILQDYYMNGFNEDAIDYEKCLFKREFLLNYISNIVNETINRLMRNTMESPDYKEE